MNSVTPVKITLPDGVERDLRFTLGAKKMIVDLLGLQLRDALNKYDSGAFPAILFALMHNEKGEAPSVDLKWLEGNLSDEDTPDIMAAILSASSQGKTPKNELEVLVRKAMETEKNKMIGSISLASELSASDSAETSSGGDISSARSPQE